jgi:hypothetical protein
VSDPAVHPAPLDVTVAWLAAYTLGLVCSSTDDHRRLTDLLDTAGRRPDLFRAAGRQLRATDVADPTIRREALRLLAQARLLAMRDATPSGRRMTRARSVRP